LYDEAWKIFYREKPQPYRMFELFKRVIDKEMDDGSYRGDNGVRQTGSLAEPNNNSTKVNRNCKRLGEVSKAEAKNIWSYIDVVDGLTNAKRGSLRKGI
ncbi:MAG: hypothetical protein ACXU99_15590, partial [Thermodesulfobacteriota bacterium]